MPTPSPTIGALLIGQRPRPDLVEPLEQAMPGCKILQAGALDGLAIDQLPDPTGAEYPLATRMRDGSRVRVPEDFLAPLLQKKLDRLEENGATATILLCAGTFANLAGRRPLLKPFNTALAALQSLGLKRIGLLAPFPAQETPIQNRWQAAGFNTTVWSADIRSKDPALLKQAGKYIAAHNLQCLLLDYVGHPRSAVQWLQRALPIPVLDIGDLAIRTMAVAINTSPNLKNG